MFGIIAYLGLVFVTSVVGSAIGGNFGPSGPSFGAFFGLMFGACCVPLMWPDKWGSDPSIDCSVGEAQDLCTYPPTMCPRCGGNLRWVAKPIMVPRREYGAAHLAVVGGTQFVALCRSCTAYSIYLSTHLAR